MRNRNEAEGLAADDESTRRSPTASAIGQWRAVYVLVVVFFLAGLYAVAKLPEQVYPTLSFSRVLVVAENGDLAPSLVQSSIARPLEQQLASLLGAQQIVANSTQGAAAISITFDPKAANINVALQRVSTAVATIQSRLPKNTDITIQQVDPSLFPVMGYALSSDSVSRTQLRELAQYQVKPQLLGLTGVSSVSVLGGGVREYLVSVDPVKLAAHGITLDKLTAAIAQTNTITSVGQTDNHYIRSTLLATGQAHTPQDIADIPVTSQGGVPITVGTLAAVIQAPAPPVWATRADGKPAVIVNVFAQPGASFVNVAKVVSSVMGAIHLKDVTVSRFWNQAVLVSNAIAALRDAILIGLVLSTLVLFFFLRNWPLTVVAASVIPLSIVMTFAFMAPLHQGLNLMTLGGLAVGVGLIIDDAIVVVENIYRQLNRGENRSSAVAVAVSEVAAPMISSTLTTIVVFAPLGLLSGVAGAFFRALAITLSIALILSLLLALGFTPSIAQQFLHATGEEKNTFVMWVHRRYQPVLRRALLHRKAIVTLALIIMAITALLGTRLGTDFMPRLDEGAFETEFRLPPGTTLAETEAVAQRIESVVRRDPAVRSDALTVGLSMAITDVPGGTNAGILRATLTPKSQRAPITQVMSRIAQRVSQVAPNVQFTSKQLLEDMLNELSNAPAPIEIRVFGPEQSVLIATATDVASRITSVPGVIGAFNGAVFHNPNVVLAAAPGISAFGVTPSDLSTDEAVAFGGDVVSQVIANPLTIPVRVRYNLPLNPTLAQVAGVPIVTPSGGVQPLSRLATLQEAPPQSEINELNGRQYLGVTAQLGVSNLGAVVSGIRDRLQKVALPSGYTTQIAGAYALQNESFSQFALAIALSSTLVFLVMVFQFRSFFQPLAIIATIPLALFGAVLALFITRISLNVSSLMGVILLVGLVVKNGILLLEYASRRERLGEPVVESLVYAARVRLRPIVMTTLTALLGMLPLAFAFGSGSELLQPLAIAIIGGLSFSTFITLIIIPVIYASLVREGKWREKAIPPELGGPAEEALPTHA